MVRSPRERFAEEENARVPDAGGVWLDWLIVAILVAVILYYFRSLIWTDTYIYGELDIRRSIYLFKKVSYQLMRGGDMPLWMPYIYCGMPLLGSFLATPFYPPDLVFALANVPLNKAFNWDLLLHLAAAQVFSYFFFKRLLKSRAGAVFCSMWFWNIFFLNSIIIGDALNIRAMLLAPMVFYFLDVALADGVRFGRLLPLSLAVALQVLSGGVQFAFYTLAAGAGYAAFVLLLRPRPLRDRLRLSLGVASAVAVALMLAGIQLAPQWEFSRLSLRAVPYDWFRVWAIQPHQLLDYVFSSSEQLGYFGIAPIVLAFFSLFFWKDRRKYFFLLLGFLSILYALGGNTRISALLAGLPLVREFRGPFRAAIFFNFSVFALAGGAVASALQNASRFRSKRNAILFGVLTLFLLIAYGTAFDASRSLLHVMRQELYFSAAVLTISLLLVFLLFFGNGLRRYFALLLIAALAFDLWFHYGGLYSPSLAFAFFRKDSTVRFLEKHGQDARIAVYNTPSANYFGLFGIESATGHHPFPLLRSANFLPLLESNPRLASLAGVGFSITYDSHPSAPVNPPITDRAVVTVRQMPFKPLERAFLVSRYETRKSSDDALAALQKNFDPASEVILERDPGPLVSSPTGELDGRARVVSDEANRVVVEATCDRDALLVLTDTYYPGWRARVDGNEAGVLCADYVFRAVRLAAGTHTVEFFYEPKSVIIGALLAFFGGAIFLMGGILSIRGRTFTITQKPDLPL